MRNKNEFVLSKLRKTCLNLEGEKRDFYEDVFFRPKNVKDKRML